MRRAALLLLLLLTFPGCSYRSAPETVVPPAAMKSLDAVAGTYENRGDPEGRLSQLLFTGSDQLDHDAIDAVRVRVADGNVTVTALSRQCTVLEKTYAPGRDFQFIDGNIVLHEDFSALTRGGDDPLLGPSHEKAVIGLDQNGDGLYRSESQAAGMVFLLIPAAVSAATEIRFKRLPEPQPTGDCEAFSPSSLPAY